MHEELWERFQQDRSIENRNRLVEANLLIVHHVLHRYYANHSWYEDLHQVGVLGLIKSIDRFDPALGFRFGSFAVKAIWSEISHFLRDKRHVIKVSRNKKPYIHCSLNAPIFFSHGIWEEWIDVLPSGEVSTGEFNLSAEMLTEIGKLPEQYRKAIDFYYFQGLNRNQTAELMGVSSVTVGRYLTKGLDKLRGNLSAA